MKSILRSQLKNKLQAILFSAGLLLSVNTFAQCTASFYSVPDSAGTGVNFVSTSTGTTGSTVYTWSFGDNSSGTGANPYHQYPAAGWYLVCLTIYDTTNFCQSTTCDSVYAGGNGTLFCQAYFSTQVNGLTVAFLDQSIGNNLNYHWDFGDGNSVNGQNATHTYLLPGQYLVCLTVWNTTCSDTLCATVNVGGGGGCQASFFTADSAGVTYFYNTSTSNTGGSVSYVWDFGDGNFAYTQHASHTYNSTTAFYACLTVTYTDTINQTILCTSTSCDTIFNGGGNGCQAAFIFTYGTTLGEVLFTDQSTADSIVSWYWDFGDNTTSTLQNPSHVYSQTGAYYVCLTIAATDSNGTVSCTSTWCSWVQVQGGSGCQASFYAYDSAGVVYFVNTSTGVNIVTASFFWDFGDNTTSTLINPSHVYNSNGPFIVCLTVADSMAGCFDTFCDTIYLNGTGLCQASFVAIPDSAGTGYSFFNTSTGVNLTTSYVWTVSDGTNATGQTFQHTFITQGWFQVCLTITVYDTLQNILCTSTYCDSVFAGGGGGSTCNALFGYQASQFVSFFADLSTGTDSVTSWLWDFGDNTISTLQNPVHTYSQSGFYNVCLTIQTTSMGVITCTDTYCQIIYVGPNTTLCQANFGMVPDTTGLGFQFQNLSTGTTGTTTYAWDFGDGNTSTQENPFHLYATAGIYTVCLTISDSVNNCFSTVCDTINVGTSMFCNPYFVWNSDSLNGVQFNQFNNNLPGMVYEWSFGDGDSSSAANPYHSYASAAAYYACLTVFQLDSNGLILCTGTYCDSVYAGANFQCAPQITATPDSNGWGNGNTNFSVYSSCGSITSVTWDFGDGNTGTGINASHQYAATGWYLVCVDVEINGIIYSQCDSIFALRLVGIGETEAIGLVSMHPNPVSSVLSVDFNLTQENSITASLHDITGSVIYVVESGRLRTGSNRITIDVSALTSGVYVVTLRSGNATASRRIIISR